MSTQQTKARLEALAAKWRDQANKALRRSGTWSGNDMADRIEYMADDLDQIRSSLPEPGVVSDEAINAAVIAAQDVCPSRILSWKQAEAALEAALPYLTPPTAPEAAPAGEVVGRSVPDAELWRAIDEAENPADLLPRLISLLQSPQPAPAAQGEYTRCSDCHEPIGYGICLTCAECRQESLAATAQQPVAVDGVTNAQAVKARRPIMDALREAYVAGESHAHFNYGFLAWRVVDRVAAALRSGSQPEPQS